MTQLGPWQLQNKATNWCISNSVQAISDHTDATHIIVKWRKRNTPHILQIYYLIEISLLHTSFWLITFSLYLLKKRGICLIFTIYHLKSTYRVCMSSMGHIVFNYTFLFRVKWVLRGHSTPRLPTLVLSPFDRQHIKQVGPQSRGGSPGYTCVIIQS